MHERLKMFDISRQNRIEDVRHLSTSSIKYRKTNLEKDGFEALEVPQKLFVPRVNPLHLFYLRQHAPFDCENYLYASPPIDLGNSLLEKTVFDSKFNVLRMPIKMPGSQIIIPKELLFLKDFIQRIFKYEASFNGKLSKCFVHLTVDYNSIEEGHYHRYPNWHGDGLQGAKFSQKTYTPIEHSYVVVSSPPTEFCLQPFFVQHLDDSKHNIFQEFEVQARDENIFKTIPWHIYLIDPYAVHRTPLIEEACSRLFIRVTFAYSELQNPHNTLNPNLPNNRTYPKQHDIRDFLTLYPGKIPYERYGLAGQDT